MPTIPAIREFTVPSADKARSKLTDVAYVGVGAAVLTAQQVQTARKELQERLEDGFAKLINLRPEEVRAEIRDFIDTDLRARIDEYAKAGRERLGKDTKPAPKTSTKAPASKTAA
ncbi:MAG: hypothetical protein KY395_02240 [Actinobacteria bacterium]|nr:hypothetical protein [Actinomycetota bacterium]